MRDFKLTHLLWAIIGVATLVSVYAYDVLKLAPNDFPKGQNFTVEENETLRSVSLRLERDHYVHSALLFRALISSLGRDRKIKAGGYTFDEPLPINGVVKKFAEGHPDVPLLFVTIPEGSTSQEIAELVHKALPSVSVGAFMAVVRERKLDGMLFPSTYYLLPSNTAESIALVMKSTFDTKYGVVTNGSQVTSPLTSNIDVLSLAAILEGEAKNKNDMEVVAGILLKRLKMGMALQVDVAPVTYKEKGLPDTPINNPGEVAIQAVFNAITSPYLYYITGKDGKMYYAKTFDEHKINIQRYLR